MNAPFSSPDARAGAPALHRARHLAGLCQGRTVHLAGQVDNASRATIAAVATLVDSSAEIVLSLAAQTAPALLSALSGLVARCDQAGMLVLCEQLVGQAEGDAALAAVLAKRFRHVATLAQLPLAASAILPQSRRSLRLLPLTAPPQAGPLCLIHLCADSPLALPGPALHEQGAEAAWSPPSVPAAAVAGGPLAMPPSGLPEALAELRARAVALAERLERRAVVIFDQEAQLEAWRRQGGETVFCAAGTLRGPAGDWPLAENPDAAPDRLGLYERRPDDPVILESRRGEAFLAQHDLLGDAPDFTGAIAAINALQRVEPLAPEVSIVLPVYGQLAWTLNCLHSLFSLPDETGFEVILVDDASPDGSGAVLADLRGLRLVRATVNRGFLQSCNHGASLALGGFVLMLNNDTRVVPGWLDALVDSFTLFPRAGLVGSKLFYPDGRLQEAGGILWRDGSAWNDGRDDDPNRPCYCVARQVDYVSGCAIMLPTGLWRELGGFDPLFAPAYCEDADLALRLRAAGHEVWFQPLSRVIHYEGRTSGTDVTQGVKAYQVANTKKLFLRWHESLAGHRDNGEQPLRERERRVVRRALVIDATAPTPNQDGGSVVAVCTMQLFQRLGYKVHYVPQDNFLYQPAHIAPLQREGIEAAYAPYDLRFGDYMRQHGALFDVVLVFRVTILERVLEDLRRHSPRAPLLFHNMDLHFLRMERQAEAEDDDAQRAAAAEMRVRELAMIDKVDATITHSTYERDLLTELSPAAPVVVWPFMFPLHGTAVGFADRRDLCFLGGYTHAPNVDAVIYMVERIMPLIWQEEPEARFIIAGAKPGPEVLALAGPKVVVTGQIDDLREVFDPSRVFVCPLRVGAGTKGKIITAMAYGMPVVSTGCGAEGMDLIDGQEVLIAEGEADFAAACLRVYREPALWRLLSEAGQRLVQDKHSVEMGARVLGEAIETGLKHHLGLDHAH